MHCDASKAYRCNFVGEAGHISYLSNSYGISLLLDDCAHDDRVICHRQIRMHFFRVNAKEWNVDRCHRKSPGADDWPVTCTAARACTGVYTLLLRHVKVWLPQENT